MKLQTRFPYGIRRFSESAVLIIPARKDSIALTSAGGSRSSDSGRRIPESRELQGDSAEDRFWSLTGIECGIVLTHEHFYRMRSDNLITEISIGPCMKICRKYFPVTRGKVSVVIQKAKTKKPPVTRQAVSFQQITSLQEYGWYWYCRPGPSGRPG